jgi:hypothetical protein
MHLTFVDTTHATHNHTAAVCQVRCVARKAAALREASAALAAAKEALAKKEQQLEEAKEAKVRRLFCDDCV